MVFGIFCKKKGGVAPLLFFLFLSGRFLNGSLFALRERHFVFADVDGALREFAEVVEYLPVVHPLFVEDGVTFFHMVGNQIYELFFLLLVLQRRSFFDELRDGFAVVHVSDARDRVREVLRTLVEGLLLDYLVWVVDVEFEVGHDGQVVPKDVLEVVDVPEVGEKVAHRIDDGVGAASPFVPVLYSHAVVYHVLDVPAVFGKLEPLQLRVVIYIVHKFKIDSTRWSSAPRGGWFLRTPPDRMVIVIVPRSGKDDRFQLLRKDSVNNSLFIGCRGKNVNCFRGDFIR